MDGLIGELLDKSVVKMVKSLAMDEGHKVRSEELRGIIWGCNVNDARKDKVRSIIEELCTNTGRTDFEFYQAVKDPASHEIWIERAW